MKDKQNKKERKKQKKEKKEKKANSIVITEPKKEDRLQEISIPQEVSKEHIKAGGAIEKWMKKLQLERDLEKEFEEESELDEDISPKLKTKEITENEYITCPNCKQLTIVIDNKCSVCNFHIKK